MDIKSEVMKIESELIGLRREFHAIPEIGLEEFKTASKIQNYLGDCGISIAKIGETGVVGLLGGKNKGPTLMLRADIDALPLDEMTDLPFKSTHVDRMHACGHDTHIAMLLVAAKILKRMETHLKGTIKLLFQPNEENFGARDMLEANVLEEPHVDAAIATHILSKLETGKIGISAGPVMGGGAAFKIKVIGKGGHTAEPHHSIDPILTSASIIENINSMVTRENDPLRPPSIVFGRISGGSACNIIPQEVEMEGTIRWLHEDISTWPEYANRFKELVESIGKSHRARCEVTYPFSNHSVINDPRLATLIKSSALEVVENPDDVVSYATLIGEDFSEYGLKIPIALFFVGTGSKEKGTDYPHHHPCFKIDERSLALGVETHVRSVLAFFESWS